MHDPPSLQLQLHCTTLHWSTLHFSSALVHIPNQTVHSLLSTYQSPRYSNHLFFHITYSPHYDPNTSHLIGHSVPSLFYTAQVQHMLQAILRFCSLEETLVVDAMAALARRRASRMDMEERTRVRVLSPSAYLIISISFDLAIQFEIPPILPHAIPSHLKLHNLISSSRSISSTTAISAVPVLPYLNTSLNFTVESLAESVCDSNPSSLIPHPLSPLIFDHPLSSVLSLPTCISSTP